MCNYFYLFSYYNLATPTLRLRNVSNNDLVILWRKNYL